MLKSMNFVNSAIPLISAFYTDRFLYIATKKGLTSFIAYKPLCLLVGGTGFEPVTSTV
jgi:hypothetical protein